MIRLLHILPYLGRIRRWLLWIQEVNWMHIRCSKDVQNIFWTSYGRSIYVLCPGGKKQWSKNLPPQSECSKIGKLKPTVFGPFCPWKALNFGSLKMQKVGHFTHCMSGAIVTTSRASSFSIFHMLVVFDPIHQQIYLIPLCLLRIASCKWPDGFEFFNCRDSEGIFIKLSLESKTETHSWSI